MIGAIIGDIVGSPYEFDRGDKTKDFPLFSPKSHFTDDSVMTVAVAEALIKTIGKTDREVTDELIASMRRRGREYPDAGSGGRFIKWLFSEEPMPPYNSFGNGSAMRVSSAGWLYKTLEETRHYARLTARVTHNHPEGIKGAESVASAIFLARKGKTKAEIKEYIEKEFHYDLSRTCDEIRPGYFHVESCQETVPEAITAFLEGEDFEDVIRTAVSLGGDCDTLTCIAGSIAEAFYGIPGNIKDECIARIPDSFTKVLAKFDDARDEVVTVRPGNFRYNEFIGEAANDFFEQKTNDSLLTLFGVISKRIADGADIFVPVYEANEGNEIIALSSNVDIGEIFSIRRDVTYRMESVDTEDNGKYIVAFTTVEELSKEEDVRVICCSMKRFFETVAKMEEISGIMLNPSGDNIILPKDVIEMLLKNADGT